ncbi:hypothetical protein BASA60_000948 [Batrachochytrium salamandrivorans]|nr:hypothetical protein BASA60_000948 [Batrachochytrium salamandrivorans]
MSIALETVFLAWAIVGLVLFYCLTTYGPPLTAKLLLSTATVVLSTDDPPICNVPRFRFTSAKSNRTSKANEQPSQSSLSVQADSL